MVSAKLFVLKQERELLWIDTDYSRDTNYTNGKPSGEVNGGLIKLCFAAEIGDDIFLRWMTKESQDKSGEEKDKMEEGKILFYERGFDFPPTKTYTFKDAFLVSYKEYFSSMNGMQVMLTISPAIQDYGAYFLKRWNVSHVDTIPEKHTLTESVKNNDEPEIVKKEWRDQEGNRIEESDANTNSVLFLKVKNIDVGEELKIVLENKHDTSDKIELKGITNEHGEVILK